MDTDGEDETPEGNGFFLELPLAEAEALASALIAAALDAPAGESIELGPLLERHCPRAVTWRT